MEKPKDTKKSLLLSVLSLLLCCAMLIGTTYAWFSDSASSGKNKIVAGNLAVDLIHVVDDENGNGTKDVSMKENPAHQIFNYDKWEPGYTAVETLKVVNKGTLALKFRLDAVSQNATPGENGAKLSDVIDVYVYDGTDEDGKDSQTIPEPKSFEDLQGEGWRNAGALSSLMSDKDGMAYGVLLPHGATPKHSEPVESVQMTVALHMRENAGNEYQGLSLGDVTFTLHATQYTYESDSFGDQYDDAATLPVESEEELDTALAEAKSGDTVFVGDIKLSSPIVVDKDITLKGTEGSTLEDAIITGQNDAEVTIEDVDFTGEGYINSHDMSSLTMNGCDIDVTVPEKVGGNSRAAFIVLDSSEWDSVKLDIRNNHITVKSDDDPFAAAIFGWTKVENGSVISGNTFGSEENRYTFTAMKLMNFEDNAKIDISNNTVYGTDELNSFLGFDMYQNNSRNNRYTATFTGNTVNAKEESDKYKAYFLLLECEGGNGNATIQIGDGNTFNGQSVTEQHIELDGGEFSPGKVEYLNAQ